MAKYSDIKGFTVQTLSTDTVASQAAGGTWASGGTINTFREEAGGAGIQTAALLFGGQQDPSASPRRPTAVEEYDGSSWSESGDIAAGVTGIGGCGTQTAALACGGYTGTANVDTTQTYNGASWTTVPATINPARAFIGLAGTTTAAITFGSASGPGNQVELYNGSSWTETTEMNTARYAVGGSGTSTAAMFFGGTPSLKANNELWNGSSWSEENDLNTARKQLAGTGGVYTQALAISGYTTTNVASTESFDGTSWTEVADVAIARRSLSGGTSSPNGASIVFAGYGDSHQPAGSATEEWTAPADFVQLQQGQLFFNSTTNTFKETITDIAGTSWSAGGSMNTARRGQRGAGSITAGLVFGGGSPPPLVLTESYDGTTFTAVNTLNSAKNNGAGFGTQASAIATNEANVEIWNGTSWAETAEVNTDRTSYAGATGPTSAGIVFGGYTSTYAANTETWNGAGWTAVNNLNNARSTGGGAGLNSGDAICILGDSNPYSNAYVETWNGTNWTEVTQANTGRYYNGASGASSTSAITYGGQTTTDVNNTEVWNGSTWTEINNLATARKTGGSGNVGSTSASAFYAGGGFPDKTNMEEFSADLANKTITAS
jgi:hypothetical protein